MRDGRTPPVIFSLQEAQALLPTVKHLTAEAVRQSEELGARLLESPEQDPAHAEISEALRDVVEAWAGQVRALGVEVKGPWLVDFDNGHGYYCWQYPEESVAHYHDYDAGFAGRMKIL